MQPNALVRRNLSRAWISQKDEAATKSDSGPEEVMLAKRNPQGNAWNPEYPYGIADLYTWEQVEQYLLHHLPY